MRKLLVYQHVPFEPLGTLDRQFRDAGFRIRYVNFHRDPDAQPSVARYHGLIVLGGPMSADQIERHPHLAFERESIRAAVHLGMPVLGICLGAQLIAASLGARTFKHTAAEIGWFDVSPTAEGRHDPLIRHFGASEKIFQWHTDSFNLPAGATLLARSELCEHQAFRFGEMVYGLQFHLETDEPLIRRWLKTPHHQRELAALGGSGYAQGIAEQTPRYIERTSRLSRAVFGEFIERFYRLRATLRRRVALPSR
jgi:GMP synthase (glutamine-hydrolysing)